MSTLIFGFSFLLVIALLAAVFLVVRKSQTTQDLHASRFQDLIRSFESRLGQLQQQMDARLRDQNTLLNSTQGQIGERLDNAARVVGQVQNQLGQLEEANRRIFEVGKDLQSLQDILRAPKQRGVLGELFLGDLLGQMLPKDRFKMQYAFKSNEKADAVVCLAQGLVSVDAKFPLENFRRYMEVKDENQKSEYYRALIADTKKHIDQIAAKYIVPDEGTLDFALMYIPAENVYYEIVLSDHQVGGQRSLIQYALEKHVIPVSPNTLFAYLQTVLLGLRGLKIEERARSIQDLLMRLRLDFGKLADDLVRLGKHLDNAKTSFDSSIKRTERIQGRMGSLEEGEGAEEKAAFDEPVPIPHSAPDR